MCIFSLEDAPLHHLLVNNRSLTHRLINYFCLPSGYDSSLGHFCCFKVAVARAWRISVFSKCPWLESGASMSFRSACGSSLAHFCLFKAAVVRVWRNSVFSKCLWLESGAFLFFQSACGLSLAHFCLFKVPVARV